MKYRDSHGNEEEISEIKTNKLLNSYKKVFKQLNSARIQLTKQGHNKALERKIDRLEPLVEEMRKEISNRKHWDDEVHNGNV